VLSFQHLPDPPSGNRLWTIALERSSVRGKSELHRVSMPVERGRAIVPQDRATGNKERLVCTEILLTAQYHRKANDLFEGNGETAV